METDAADGSVGLEVGSLVPEEEASGHGGEVTRRTGASGGGGNPQRWLGEVGAARGVSGPGGRGGGRGGRA